MVRIMTTEIPLWFSIPFLLAMATLGYLAGGLPL